MLPLLWVITNSDESAFRREVEDLISIKIKAREIIVDFRRLASLIMNNVAVERVMEFSVS